MSGPIDSSTLGRLVDDELAGAERADLLARLDAEPDGWRACAIAFLEDQAFATGARRAVALGARPLPTPTLTTPSPRRVRLLTQLALAATFSGVGFLVGLQVDARRDVVKPELVAREADPTMVGPGPDRSPQPDPTERFPRGAPAAAVRPGIADYVRSQWERRGYQIDQKPKLVSMDLGDGRQVAVPVNEIRVEFVGRPTY